MHSQRSQVYICLCLIVRCGDGNTARSEPRATTASGERERVRERERESNSQPSQPVSPADALGLPPKEGERQRQEVGIAVSAWSVTAMGSDSSSWQEAGHFGAGQQQRLSTPSAHDGIIVTAVRGSDDDEAEDSI